MWTLQGTSRIALEKSKMTDRWATNVITSLREEKWTIKREKRRSKRSRRSRRSSNTRKSRRGFSSNRESNNRWFGGGG